MKILSSNLRYDVMGTKHSLLNARMPNKSDYNFKELKNLTKFSSKTNLNFS